MTSKDSGRSFRQGRRTSELESESKEIAIKSLDLRTCLEFYGISFNAQGFAHCPFHKERTASFRMRGRFWHCFGCNESGEIIKFVRKKFNLNYYEAINTICSDFRINASSPTIADLERLDSLRFEQYNLRRRYDELLHTLDIRTALYWLAYDAAEYTTQFYGGKNIENERYVDAYFALMAAQKALEQAEYDCAQYIKDNPAAMIKPVQKPSRVPKRTLPPAPKTE